MLCCSCICIILLPCLEPSLDDIKYDDFHIVKKTAVATCDKVSVCLSVCLSVLSQVRHFDNLRKGRNFLRCVFGQFLSDVTRAGYSVCNVGFVGMFLYRESGRSPWYGEGIRLQSCHQLCLCMSMHTCTCVRVSACKHTHTSHGVEHWRSEE